MKKIFYKKELSLFRFEFEIKPEFNTTTRKDLLITGYSGYGDTHDQERGNPYDILYNRLNSLLVNSGYFIKSQLIEVYAIDFYTGQNFPIFQISESFTPKEGRPFVIFDAAVFKTFKDTNTKRIEAILYKITEICTNFKKAKKLLTGVKRKQTRAKTVEEMLDTSLYFGDKDSLIAYCQSLNEKELVPYEKLVSFYQTVFNKRFSNAKKAN